MHYVTHYVVHCVMHYFMHCVMHYGMHTVQCRRAVFLTRNLWVTPYRAAERYPGGDFPNQAA